MLEEYFVNFCFFGFLTDGLGASVVSTTGSFDDDSKSEYREQLTGVEKGSAFKFLKILSNFQPSKI